MVPLEDRIVPADMYGWITTNSSGVVREGDTIEFTVTLNRAPENPEGVYIGAVPWEWNVTPAASTYDWYHLSGNYHVPQGETSCTFTIQIENDTLSESTEYFQFAGDYFSDDVYDYAYIYGVVLITILDNDTPPSDLVGGGNCPPSIGTLPTSGGNVAPPINPISAPASVAPIRYADGAVVLSVADLQPQNGWMIGRSWTNASGYSGASPYGGGWVDIGAPRLMQGDATNDSLAIVTNGTAARYFDRDTISGLYSERYADGATLTHDAVTDEYVLTYATGSTVRFYDFSASWLPAQRGGFAGSSNPSGNKIDVTSHHASGFIGEVQQVIGSGATAITESFVYSYGVVNGATDQLESVVHRRKVGSGSWSTVESVEYTYYREGESHGSFGDLKTVTIKSDSGTVIDTSYYRYYLPGDPNGYGRGLKYVIEPQAYARMVSELGGVLDGLTDLQVAGYADFYFEYDSSLRVTREVAAGTGCSVCAAGQGEYTYAYTASSNTAGMNNWAVKTTVEHPGGSTETVYTNTRGLVMLRAFTDEATSQTRVDYYRYNGEGQVVLQANPSAVSGYNDSYADLVHFVSNNAQYLQDSTGLVTRYDYYTTTTATDTTAGGVEGYQKGIAVRRGELGTDVPQSLQTYIERTAGGVTIYPIAATTVYSGAGGIGALTTTNNYTWYSGTVQAHTVTTTLPSVSTANNGPNSATSSVVAFDEQGRAIWTRDASGYLTYREYDEATGAVIKQIVDVDTNQTGDFANLPGGWSTPGGGGLHLVTTCEVDHLGRVTKAIDPAGRVDYTVYNDVSHEVRYYPGWDAGSNMPTGPTIVTRTDRALGYTETLTLSATPVVSSGRPTGTEAISGVLSLSRSYTNEAGQVIYSDAYFYLTGLSYSTAVNIGTEGTHFYRTHYQYDSRGQLTKTTMPSGTIYRTVFDGQGRAVSEWVGTDDTPTTGYWSPANTAGTDLVMVRSYEYDGGGVGDGNLTRVTEYPGLGADPRVTESFFDWRNRLVATKSGVETSESASVNRPITYTEYDNLGRVVSSELYDGDTVTIADANNDGVPDRPSNALLRAKSTAEYDELSRAFRTHVYSVDPATGTVSTNSLTTETWFDARGYAVKQESPGGLVQKMAYDGAGRLTVAYVSDGGGDTGYADALTVSGDTVLSQTGYGYDDSGNVILTTTRERFHDASGTGALGTPSSGVGARVYYSAAYYDVGGRLTANVDVGTNGGSTYTRPGTVPSRSDTVLITSCEYDADGRVWQVTDPRGVIGQTHYDRLGRTVRTIENYIDGVQGDIDDKTTVTTYGPAGMTSLTALTGGGSGQTTEWIYGVTTAGGHGLNSYDIVSETRWPDPATGVASVSETETVLVNALGQTVETTDRNGTIHAYSYDVLGRPILDEVTTGGTGVILGSVRKIATAYDGQGNAYLFTSLNSSNGIVNQVKRDFNGLGQLVAEWQATTGYVYGSTPRVQYTYSEMASGANHSRLTGMIYPSGYELDYNYASGLDSDISRLSSLSDSTGTLESYAYLGLSTVVVRSRPQPDVDLTYVKQGLEPNGDAGDQYAGLDRFGRIEDQRWIDAGSGIDVDRYEYGYDRGGNRVFRDNLVNSALGEVYTYDNLGQLTTYDRGTLNGSKDGITGTVGREIDWDYDALGNWYGVDVDGVTETRTHNAQNEITAISGATSPQYLANGSMSRDEQGRLYSYNAWNQLIMVRAAVGGTILVEYSYDALGRRKTVSAGGVTTTLYNSANWQTLEERIAGEVVKQYVYSPGYVDEYVLRDRDTDENGTLDERLWVQQDANFNVVGLVDSGGSVVERYAYDPFGAATVLDGSYAVRVGGSLYSMTYLWQGRPIDSVSATYDFRERVVSPTLGRPIQVDPLHFLAGDVNFYRWEANSPINRLDPSGLANFKIDGYKFFVHPNDADPFPSDPHAHVGGPNSTTKIDINTGEIYKGAKPTGDFLGKKTLAKLREQMRGKGLLCVAFAVVLATPEIVQAGQQGGVQGAATATGNIVVDGAIGVGTSTVVGVGVTATATAAGTTVTVGGAAVTTVAGATGVGGAVIVTAAGGYAIGDAIGSVNVGGQTIHDHIADGMIGTLEFFGLW